jgi:hypothetical protein
LFVGLVEVGLKLHVVFVGKALLQVKVTVPLYPLLGVTVSVY